MLVGVEVCDVHGRMWEAESLDDVWKHSPGVTLASMDHSVEIETADGLPRDNLRNLLCTAFPRRTAAECP